MDVPGAPQEDPRRLADFLRARRDEILAAWESDVRRIRAAQNLEQPILLDHMPDFIEDLAHYVDDLRAGLDARSPDEVPRRHALERLEVGYDLAEVVEEYAALRRCILELVVGNGAPAMRSVEMPRLHQAIDRAIATSVVRYTEARERTLRALDRISSAALMSPDASSLLPAALDAFLVNTASVDSVAVLLREGNDLVVRGASGYHEPLPSRLPEDAFGWRVIRGGAPIFVGDASSDHDLADAPLRSPGTHAMYGVPIVIGDQILGAAVMGSRTSYELSQEDQFLFRTLVHRVAGLIAQARLAAELADHARELEAALQFRNRILGILGHDLRNPLTVILTSAGLLQRMDALDEKQQRAVTRITANANRIERMVHDLLDYTRIDQGNGIRIEPRDCDMLALCQQVLDGLQVIHPDRDIQLSAQGDTHGRWDPDRAIQVISNLVTNALDYSPPGTPVKVQIRGEGDAVLLEVHNAGAPIPEEILPQLFEAFQRGSAERGPARSGGLGLGLWIVQHIVGAHGGAVEVRSTPSEGTTFRLRWPRDAAWRPAPPSVK